MPEINLNGSFAEIFTNHGIGVAADDEFIFPTLPSKIKIKAKANYEELNGTISSRLDVMIITEKGEKIIECFGDWGSDVDAAIRNNLLSFKMGILHPLLATFGDSRPETLEQITLEEWEINGREWTIYMGNTVPKTDSKDPLIRPPAQFFNAVESGIRSQKLKNNLHWFRGYYLQYHNEIKATEFLMDNEDITAGNPLFTQIPAIPDAAYYSCRTFIILKQERRLFRFFKFK